MSAYDLLIKNGHVIDPGSAVEGQFDSGFANGKIEKIATNINGRKQMKVLTSRDIMLFPATLIYKRI